ncbi:MAG: Rrf2 family transcriptional regulator [Phycisphaerae bacterium]|nr:Rrf2 family transcriptional regulator [Phycisphaerae bacterium]
MDLIRRDTDYAFRLAAKLTAGYADPKALSAKLLAKETQVSYALTCKILQKLAHTGLVESVMGPKGGWKLAKKPETIEFRHLIEAIQGPIAVNRCLLGNFKCPLKKKCPARPKMAVLQTKIDDFLKELTLKEFVNKEPENE